MLRHWLCNRTWLQQIQSISLLNSASEHGQKMILSGSVASELITQLCDDVTAQGVSALESSVMATMCNRDLNTLKCQGGGDSTFWSVSFCAENPIWVQLIYYSIRFSVFTFVRVMYILKLIRGKCQLYTSINILCSKLNPKGQAKATKSPREDCSR